MKKKILISCLHRPDRSPSQRFRFEQYLEILSQNGFEYTYSYLINEKDDNIFYAKGHYLAKLYILIKSCFKRIIELKKLDSYDIIYVQREAFMLGTTFFERQYAKSSAFFILDFDDSIWLQNVSNNNKSLSFLKNAKKTDELIHIADKVVAGNSYLADYALKLNKNCIVIPTTVDTDKFSPTELSPKSKVCIGWSGSPSTIEHFKTILPLLHKIQDQFGDSIYFKVIGAPDFSDPLLQLTSIPWSSETEVSEMQEFDIGIMPLPNNEWTKGKCGLKGLTYMSLEITTVMSAVGVNNEIIQNGINGFLCEDDEEWLDTLTILIQNKSKRESVQKKGRTTVIDKFSIHSQKENYIRLMNTNN